MNPAIYFAPDGYALNGPKLMGRQAAGNGFLRAAVAARGEEPLYGYAPHQRTGESFAAMVRALDPAATPIWIPANRLDLVAQRGTFYRPDQVLAPAARLRLRAGPSAYSICGVTHTIASQGAMSATADLLTGPLMAWDAVICTSSVARSSLQTMMDAQKDYLGWRFGLPVAPPTPQLPVIPLGVHCDDFAFTDEDRAEARRLLGIAEDEVVALFAGRLTFSAKVHPHAMYAALQRVVEETGRKIVLIQAGQFASPPLEGIYHSAVAQFCPSVRSVFVDGKATELYRAAWRGADFFVSLSDNIQETFGLTPVEAMAAGLPVLVSDWNGYKDTVRDGIDGFRIRTWAPAAPASAPAARDHECEVNNYDYYLSRTSTTVSMDWRQLLAATITLVTDGVVRRALGESARRRAREVLDWSVVYRQYQDLWAELAAMRLKARDDPSVQAWLATAPKAGPDNLDPFEVFGSYPTATIGPGTLVRRAPDASVERYRSLTGHTMMKMWASPAQGVENLLRVLGDQAWTVQGLADAGRAPTTIVIEMVSRLAKLGLLELQAEVEI
jgi:starch synthase